MATFREFPHAENSRQNGSQICYDTSSASTTIEAPEAFVDVITDYEEAFDWDRRDAEEVHELLEQEAREGDTIAQGAITVHLPSLETLKKTFQYSGLDYEDRIQTIEEMQA